MPVGAIKPFIECFTSEGDTVADIFAGSGMTGLAALSLGRNAKLSDISVLGQHIATGYLQDVSPNALTEASQKVVSKARSLIGDLYTTRRTTDGAEQEMIRAVWSFTYICPSCEQKMVFYSQLDETGKAPKTCSSCDEPFVRRKWGRAEDVPVRIVVIGENGKQLEQDISNSDIALIEKASKDERQKKVPSRTIGKHREMYSRSGLGKAGMTKTSMFFSSRNAIALLELWRAINTIRNKSVKQKLRFVFTAILPRASKRYQWSPKHPLNAQNQTYYIAPVYYEWNIFDLFLRKVNAAIKADQFLFQRDELFSGASTQVTYDISSAASLGHLEDESIDYVFTDPPFGSNIFYSDMNLFHEAWLGKTTKHENEAVVHTTGRRKGGSEERYEELLSNAFSEAYRVLRPGKYMSVVFGNSSGKIWGLVQRALRSAGFEATPAHVAILDKGQRSVKGLNSGSEGVVTVDLVMTVQKPEQEGSHGEYRELRNGDTNRLIRSAISELSATEAENPSHVYARILKKAIQQHLVIDELHLGDVLVALHEAGYSIDRKTGKLSGSPTEG